MITNCPEIINNKIISEIDKRKLILEEEYANLREKKTENIFLEDVYNDYNNYYTIIKQERYKQYLALKKISDYLDSLIDESNIAKYKLEELKNDKYKILGKIENIRSEINKYTSQ